MWITVQEHVSCMVDQSLSLSGQCAGRKSIPVSPVLMCAAFYSLQWQNTLRTCLAESRTQQSPASVSRAQSTPGQDVLQDAIHQPHKSF